MHQKQINLIQGLNCNKNNKLISDGAYEISFNLQIILELAFSPCKTKTLLHHKINGKYATYSGYMY